MPRTSLSQKELSGILNDSYRHGGMAEVQSNLTEEEEQQGMRDTFRDIHNLGYEHIHTLRIVPADGRTPYYVHVDDIDGE
jgi:hypothetical protein